MKRVVFLVGFAAAALLGFLAAAEPAQASEPGPATSELHGTPSLPTSLEASPVQSLRPFLGNPLEHAADGCRSAGGDARTSSSADRRSILIEAQLLEKYLAFRESLTTP